jgi:murein lipoprotein
MRYGWKKLAIAAGVAAVASMGVGCATTSELEQVRTMAQDAKTAAANAQSTADKASADAAAAMSKADEANTCCQNTNEKIDRMFKKSMYK